MMATTKPLKAQNLAWLWSVVALDTLALLLVACPALIGEMTGSGFAWFRASVSAAAPVVVLLLLSLLSSDAKALLVFWRFRETLPGHRAFSVHAVKDSRIDIEALRKNVGEFPEDAKEQNTTWYRLYIKVGNEVTVAQAHRHYLLFRDLAALSLLLAPAASMVLYYLDVRRAVVLGAFVVFLVQYAATAIAARNNGIRLVTNVLALHAAKRRV